MGRFILTLVILVTAVNGLAQDRARKVRNKECPSFIYRVTLRDKQNSPYSLNHPTRFLSKRSVERRRKQGLPLDSTDLPVTPKYVRQIESMKTMVLGTSRWNNTVLAQMRDTSELRRLRLLPCVKDCRLVWQAPDSIQPTALKTKYEEDFNAWDSIYSTPYGRADAQIKSLNGNRLHDINCMGEGMIIAVLDGGFKNVDKIPAFSRVDIKGTRDFIYPASPSVFYELDHGTKVLSTMTIQRPYYYIGTAPKASYWLLRCEDGQSEQEVEEDYWAIAAEFADSAGCDLINSSLGYNNFDKGSESHKLWQLDGHSTFISHSASFVAKKGMILVNSAGNSGMGPWKKLTFPADADDCLTVGAVTDMLTNAPFSSVGPTQDGRVKPDIVAIGSPATIVTGRGSIAQDMGTSFAAPIICGLTACLWQALPEKTALEVMELIRQSGNNKEHPDNVFGYGLPNFWRAYMVGRMKE
ncbi:MAG: S8 family serine peptidase [Prevotella sp.]|nr:S8 family serine peptidase [Prevotella sp.]MBP3775913.1 S8 family serine peptidase [Prevotella sp.]